MLDARTGVLYSQGVNTSAAHYRLPTYDPPPASPARLSIYRQYFTPAECALLDAAPVDDLSAEIDLLRFLLARVLAASQRARALSLKQHAAILAAFSAAGIVIAGLVRLQSKLRGDLDPLWRLFEEGMTLARLRHGVHGYLSPPLGA